MSVQNKYKCNIPNSSYLIINTELRAINNFKIIIML